MLGDIHPRHNSNDLAITLWHRGGSTTNPDPVPNKGEPGFRYWERFYKLNEGGLNYLISAMSNVLKIANVYDLKIIWVLGTETRYFDGEKKYNSIIQHVNHDINENFHAAIQTISSEFKDNPALFAYEICHEAESFANFSLPNNEFPNQFEVGQVVNEANDIIKNIAVNHYTTIGLFGENTFFKLGVTPFYYVDFLNFHFYDRLEDAFEQSTAGNTVNRYQYYLNKTINVPWMIGENGMETIKSADYEKVEEVFQVEESVQK